MRKFAWIGALALAGCVSPAAPSSSESARNAAADQYFGCLVRQAPIWDDGKSDPLSIGAVVASSCGVEMERMAAIETEGMPGNYYRAMLDELRRGAAEDGAAAVLAHRKRSAK